MPVTHIISYATLRRMNVADVRKLLSDHRFVILTNEDDETVVVDVEKPKLRVAEADPVADPVQRQVAKAKPVAKAVAAKPAAVAAPKPTATTTTTTTTTPRRGIDRVAHGIASIATDKLKQLAKAAWMDIVGEVKKYDKPFWIFKQTNNRCYVRDCAGGEGATGRGLLYIFYDDDATAPLLFGCVYHNARGNFSLTGSIPHDLVDTIVPNSRAEYQSQTDCFLKHLLVRSLQASTDFPKVIQRYTTRDEYNEMVSSAHKVTSKRKLLTGSPAAPRKKVAAVAAPPPPASSSKKAVEKKKNTPDAAAGKKKARQAARPGFVKKPEGKRSEDLSLTIDADDDEDDDDNDVGSLVDFVIDDEEDDDVEEEEEEDEGDEDDGLLDGGGYEEKDDDGALTAQPDEDD